MTVTRQALHQVLYDALESGDWTPEELHQEVTEVYDSWQEDKAEEEEPKEG